MVVKKATFKNEIKLNNNSTKQNIRTLYLKVYS